MDALARIEADRVRERRPYEVALRAPGTPNRFIVRLRGLGKRQRRLLCQLARDWQRDAAFLADALRRDGVRPRFRAGDIRGRFSRALRSLERRGLVRLRKGPSGRRVVGVWPTPEVLALFPGNQPRCSQTGPAWLENVTFRHTAAGLVDAL